MLCIKLLVLLLPFLLRQAFADVLLVRRFSRRDGRVGLGSFSRHGGSVGRWRSVAGDVHPKLRSQGRVVTFDGWRRVSVGEFRFRGEFGIEGHGGLGKFSGIVESGKELVAAAAFTSPFRPVPVAEEDDLVPIDVSHPPQDVTILPAIDLGNDAVDELAQGVHTGW
jgi:hypothetical protein